MFRRKIVPILLGLGVVLGYGSAIARARHGHHWRDRIRDEAASACVRAVREEDRARGPHAGPPAPAVVAPPPAVFAVPFPFWAPQTQPAFMPPPAPAAMPQTPAPQLPAGRLGE